MAPSASITGEAGALLRELPCEFWIVMLVEFLNSFRQFALGAALYQYMTLEFGFGDVETGWIKGFSGVVGTICGLSGSLLTDLLGVRRVSLLALSVACVGRGILFMARSQVTFKFAILVLTPFGDAMLGTGLYMVAVKRLTTLRTRPFAFSLQYAIFNVAAAASGVVLDLVRERDVHAFGLVWSGYRIYVGLTWIVILVAWLTCLLFLHDVKVAVNNDPSSSDYGRPRVVPFRTPRLSFNAQDVAAGYREACRILCTRNIWRVMTFSVCTIMVGKQWGDLNDVLPPFLERFYGENVPIFTISSINPVICSFAPPVIALLLAKIDVYNRMLIGLFIMGASPVFMSLAPTVPSAILWVIFMSVGEVVWSPIVSSWVASLAPSGREGLFFALNSIKNLIIGPPSSAFNGWLNAAFNPNCKECRDSHGHFCDTHVGDACQSQTPTTCVGEAFFNMTQTMQSCPSTCVECPGWTGSLEQAKILWQIVFYTSLSSPILVWLFLPFLRGDACTVCGTTCCAAAAGLDDTEAQPEMEDAAPEEKAILM